MKRSALKKEKESVKAKHEKELEEAVIPPDVLEQSADVPADKESGEDIENSVEEIEEMKEGKKEDLTEGESTNEENTDEKPSFYERVTGEDPAKHTFISEDNLTTQTDNINKRLFFLGGIVFLLTVAVATLIGLFILNSAKPDKVVTENSKNEEVPTPTAIPIVEINKDEWTFEVRNGSGVKGAAAEAKEKIEKLGYTVDQIGNADENVSKTQVFVRKGADKQAVKKVLEDLADAFGELSVEDEDSDSDAEILIILGEDQP